MSFGNWLMAWSVSHTHMHTHTYTHTQTRTLLQQRSVRVRAGFLYARRSEYFYNWNLSLARLFLLLKKCSSSLTRSVDRHFGSVSSLRKSDSPVRYFFVSRVISTLKLFKMSFVGKYERVSAENYDEFLKALDVNFLLRKAATVSTPVMEVFKRLMRFVHIFRLILKLP